MPKQWTEEHTTETVRMWREAFNLGDIAKALGFGTGTVRLKLQDAGEDEVSYGSVSRAGLEAGSTPRRLGEVLARESAADQAEPITYQPSSDVESTIQSLIDNDLAQDRDEALILLVAAGTRDQHVIAARNVEAKIRSMRDELKRQIVEGEL